MNAERDTRAWPGSARVGILALFGAALVSMAPAVAAPAAKLPFVLADPATGDRVTVGPGGQALHVVFFATWCPPCREELDGLTELAERFGEQGYRLILVAVQNRHAAERLAQFTKEQRPPGRLLFDADGKAQREWAAVHLPTHLVFDGAGREIVRTGGLDAEVTGAVERLVSLRGGKGGS